MIQKKILQTLTLAFCLTSNLALASSSSLEVERRQALSQHRKPLQKEDALFILKQLDQEPFEEIRRACSYFYQQRDFEKASKLYRRLLQSDDYTLSDCINFVDVFRNMLRQKQESSAYDEDYKKDLLTACNKITQERYKGPYDSSFIQKLVTWIYNPNSK